MIVDTSGNPIYSSEQTYEGATRSPRSYGWSAPSIGPNRALQYAVKPLRNRTRAGYRNSLLLRSGINKNTNTEIGKGFTLLSTSLDTDFKAKLDALWKVACNQLDPWGDLSFGALLKLTSLSRRMSGEVFIRKLNRRLNAGLAVPLQVELLEADLCPVDLNKKLGNNRRIIQGVEFQGKQKVAYWFYKSHPDDGLDIASLNNLERVPASDVIHHYFPTRPGQVRAEPETAAVLLKDRTFADYDDSELQRKKNKSAFTGALQRDDLGVDEWEFDPNTGAPRFSDSEAAAKSETVRAGSMLRLLPGEKISLFNGDDTGAGYADFIRWQSLLMAAGQEIPYPMLTGDWSGLNDRLVRAMLNEYHRSIAFEQVNLSGFQVAFGIWRWVIETALLVGKLHAPNYAANPYHYLVLDIRPDAWKHMHPVQDIQAKTASINSNVSNLEREAADYGADMLDNMNRNADAIKQWRDICAQKGIKNPPPLNGIFAQPEQDKNAGDDE